MDLAALPRGEPPARQEPLRGDARALRERRRARHLPGRRRRAWAACTATTPEGATAPLGGAVAGFTKAYKRERAEALVKVVDFAPGVPAAEVAEALVAETLADPGRRRGRPSRRAALRRSRSRSGRPPTAGPAWRSTKDTRLRGHRRGRRHHQRDRGRPGRRQRRHLLPARPGARARPATTRRSRSSARTARR